MGRESLAPQPAYPSPNELPTASEVALDPEGISAMLSSWPVNLKRRSLAPISPAALPPAAPRAAAEAVLPYLGEVEGTRTESSLET